MLCNSWIIVNRATGKPVMETWSAELVALVNRERCEVLTAHEWLVRFNRKVRGERK